MFEIKKILHIRIILLLLLCNIISCGVFLMQNKGVENTANADMLKELYEEIGGEITEERAGKIEEIKWMTDDVIAEESVMEQRYNEGKVTVDEYMEYRDTYHLMHNRKEAVDLVYARYEENSRTGGWMLFDGFYGQWLDPQRKQWGLILSVFLIAMQLGSCEPQGLFPILQVTRRGRNGIWREKMGAAIVSSVILTMIYGVEEAAVSRFFYPFYYLNAPVQSVSCLANISISATIGQWILLMLGIRTVAAVFFSGIVCTVLYMAKNRKAAVLILAVVTFLPMVLLEMK